MTTTKHKMPPQRRESKTEYTGFRFTADDLAEIDERAEALNMTRTQYITDKALDRAAAGPDAIVVQLDAIKRRLTRLEELAFG